MDSLHSDVAVRLFQAILSLETEEQARDFFADLLTMKEIQDISQRLEVATLLSQGKSYQQIFEKTRVSTATISRVNRSLLYGSGGYRAVIDRMKEEKAHEA